jgi:oligopeptide transport system ATP-binding protein
MKGGKIVEQGDTAQVFDSPRESYTKALMAAALSQERFGSHSRTRQS